ncbi:helix-turn-helix transcriptional regulator [Neoaquamicrobium sediminum]|uniref:helix-turn-helix transcriptional regulator n=1 Tax=Neoaquamicrobium sediminum TaxID=1849104 RepID=UPI001567A6DA|nr:AlpA family phage regulatory protein [Mesorhizobium sediminum]NRC54112.1 AlpA family phage regulatory protein [Mesorhizobium sediminum]
MGQAHHTDEDLRLLRIDRVLDLVPLGRSSLYRSIKDGSFPAPIKQGGVAMWPNSEIRSWLHGKLAERRDNGDLI